jgi:hypothetical protein
MGEVLIAGTASLLICVFLSPKFIEFLREREFGQQIREEGPQEHHAKAGTPTMGGIIIFTAIAVPFLLLTNRDARSLTVFGVAVACALLGFADDFIKNAQHARKIGDNQQYLFIRGALKRTAAVKKMLERQLLAIKNAMLIQQQAQASQQFAESMNLMAREIGRVFGEMDLTQTQAQWERAVAQAVVGQGGAVAGDHGVHGDALLAICRAGGRPVHGVVGAGGRFSTVLHPRSPSQGGTKVRLTLYLGQQHGHEEAA